MKHLIPTLLFLLLTACAGKSDKHQAVTFDDEATATEKSSDSTADDETDGGRSDYTFKTTFNDLGGGYSDEMTVQGYCKGEKTDFRHVADLSWQCASEYIHNIEWLRETDLDFDGVADLMVYLGVPPLDFYDAFLFKPATGTFERVESFEDIPNPVVDSEKKVIVSAYYEPNLNDTLYTDTYEWSNGRLKLASHKADPASDVLPDREARTFKTTFKFDSDDQWITQMTVQEYADGKKTDFSFITDISGTFDHKQAELFPWVTDEDINFDGIADLMIYVGKGDYDQASSLYNAYTWNPETHQWEYCKEFEELIEPEVDAASKTIHTSYRKGNTFYREEWKWRNGRLTKVRQDPWD